VHSRPPVRRKKKNARLGTGPQGWSADAVIALATGLLLLLAFLCVEYLKGDQAMMPLALFGSRSFVGINFLTLMLYAALAGHRSSRTSVETREREPGSRDDRRGDEPWLCCHACLPPRDRQRAIALATVKML
jgi:hypothetical protein